MYSIADLPEVENTPFFFKITCTSRVTNIDTNCMFIQGNLALNRFCQYVVVTADLNQSVCCQLRLPFEDVLSLYEDLESFNLLRLRDKGPFYLAIIENPKTNVWYKKQRLGVNSIDNMMKGLIKNTPLETSKKKLSNHIARKTVVKKLRAASVERKSIIQVTGHAREKSLDDYDEGSEKEQEQLSNIISMTSQSAASSSSPDLPMQFGLFLQRLQRLNK